MSARPTRETFCDGETFEQDGYTFTVRFPRDEDHGEPWNDYDGHGVVSAWTTRSKAPGERVLTQTDPASGTDDVKATQAIALRDGWGLAGGPLEGESTRAYAARAVDADFEFLRSWCADEWYYVGVIVTYGQRCDEAYATESVWGIESNADVYLAETARELAREIVPRLQLAAEQARIDAGGAYTAAACRRSGRSVHALCLSLEPACGPVPAIGRAIEP